MNIIEAIKSGKPFRPVGFEAWFVFSKCDFKILEDVDGKANPMRPISFSLEYILGEFELKHDPRKVTLYQYLYSNFYSKTLLSKETSETWSEYSGNSDNYKLLKTFTREIEY